MNDECYDPAHGHTVGGGTYVESCIRDMLQLTRAAADEDSDDETNEAAYAEIVEYVRVAVQLTYEELAGFRGQAGTSPVETNQTLH